MNKHNCPLCGGEVIKERESNIADFVCKDCDCLMDINDDAIYLKSEASFYIANYGTSENIEIFTSYEEAKKVSIDGNVHYASLSGDDCVWLEIDSGWNYEDCSDLFNETPYLVTKNKIS